VEITAYSREVAEQDESKAGIFDFLGKRK